MFCHERKWYTGFLLWHCKCVTLTKETSQAQFFEEFQQIKEMLPPDNWRRIMRVSMNG